MAAKQKILIVDDDNNIAELISLYLTKEMYETRIAEDGEEALSIFREFDPNLVILDLMLPGKDGYEVCREIRQMMIPRSSCSPPRARPSTRSWASSSARTIT